MNKQKLAILGTCVLGLIGSVTPWATVSVLGVSKTFNGTVGAGALTAILFGLIIVISVFGKMKMPIGLVRKIFVSLFGVLNLGMAGWNATNLKQLGKLVGGLSGEAAKVSVGWGLYLTLLASVAVIVVPWVLGKKPVEGANDAAPVEAAPEAAPEVAPPAPPAE